MGEGSGRPYRGDGLRGMYPEHVLPVQGLLVQPFCSHLCPRDAAGVDGAMEFLGDIRREVSRLGWVNAYFVQGLRKGGRDQSHVPEGGGVVLELAGSGGVCLS